MWDSRGGKTLPKVGEEDLDATTRRYSPKTAREGNWGPVNRRKGPSYHQRRSENDWEYANGKWKLKKNLETDETAAINGETRQIGFGEFADWAYAEVLMQKQ